MEEEKTLRSARQEEARENTALLEALDEVCGVLTEKQAEKLASLADVKGLKKVFGDAELMRTAEYFIANNLNISAAARALYMHRNTMMYRLDKIKRFTGLDIRSFYAAAAFKILYGVYARARAAK